MFLKCWSLVQTTYVVFDPVQVPYNISGWLEKNKDPINETVVDLLSHSKEALVQLLFSTPDAAGESRVQFVICSMVS